MSKEDFSIYWPGTDIVRSRNNGFTQGLRRSDDEWRSLTAAAAMKAASTAFVENKRKQGTDPGAIYGISQKSDERVRHGGAYLRAKAGQPKKKRGPMAGYGMAPESTTGRIRKLLASGPKTSLELALAVGTKPANVTGLMKNDVRQKRVLKIVKPGEPNRYALPEAA